MSSNTLVVNGHPNPESFCAALAASYIQGAADHAAAVQMIDLSQLQFDPVLKYGYRKSMDLEEDLQQAQKLISWADHIVFIYPNWWGSMPAVLKGFFDRTFMPGFAFKYRKNSAYWDKLLSGKTAHLIITSDTPGWYELLVNRRAGQKVMIRNILKFCGISTKKVTQLSPVRGSSEQQRQKWLAQVYQFGAKRV